MSKHDPTKRQRLKSFDFSAEGSAMHLVADFQGGPANGEAVIMTKATKDLSFEQIAKAADVKVELSMEEFLSKFFSLWGDDAAKLASLFGYEIESEEDRYEWKPFDKRIEEFNDKVTLLKSVWANAPLKEAQMLDVLNLQKSVEKSLIETEVVADVSEEVSNPVNDNISKNKETIMPDKKIEIEQETISKAMMQEMLTKALEAKDAEMAEIKKSLEEEKAARVEDKNNVLKAELKKSVASISMLQDETKEAVEAFLFKARNIEGAEVVLKALKDVQDQVKKALTQEVGVDTHVEADVAEDETDALMKAVLALNTEESK